MDEDAWWLLLGFGGQGLFMARFVVQWLASERRARSVIPVAFWYLSVAGGLVLFAYAVHRRDPVFALGQGLGIAVYLRNLRLIRGRRLRAAVRGRGRAGAGTRSAPLPARAQPGSSRPKSGSGRAR